MFRKLAVVGAACALAAAAVPVVRAAQSNPPISGSAIATQGATAVPATSDLVSISQTSYVTSDVAARARAAAQSVGASIAEGRGASLGMLGVWRGATPVQQAPPGFQIPMSTTVLPVSAVVTLMGRPIASVVGGGSIVMGSTSAGLRGAQAGDSVVLVAADGSSRTFTIGLVAADDAIGGTEILMSNEQADSLGVTTVSRLVLLGFTDRAAVDAALAAQGLVDTASIGGQRTRIRRSWDPRDPDSTLGMARTKQLLGEFAYHDTGVEWLTLDDAWTSTYLPADREWLFAYSGAPASSAATIRARCNLQVRPDLIAALGEVHAAGLDAAIDFSNANTYGGCFGPRFNRVTGNLGFVSRHSWGMALDTNTSSNAQGAVPQMNCDVVRIFRKHHFAWGGNFISRDGMHFEWVGEARDTLAYPSTYCPNQAGLVQLDTDLPLAQTQRPVMFADDGWGGD